MRGEYCAGETLCYLMDGSSPHAWGIQGFWTASGEEIRFIPTCVGNTQANSFHSTLTTVHPHMRGEYRMTLNEIPVAVGSSPHAWGIRKSPWPESRPPRFIPTCVGNTPPDPPDQFFLSVHPHMRGEYPRVSTWPADSGGSSPHAWGILFLIINTRVKLRFIPTCVGNTTCTANCPTGWPVHPHMRGEYRFFRSGI